MRGDCLTGKSFHGRRELIYIYSVYYLGVSGGLLSRMEERQAFSLAEDSTDLVPEQRKIESFLIWLGRWWPNDRRHQMIHHRKF